MENQSQHDKLAAVAVSLLLILTAWGNAVVMLVVAMLGLVVSVVFFRQSIARGGALSATLGFALAIGISLVMLLR